MADYVQPTIDVPALRKFMDGPYADIREETRKHLADNAELLDAALTMSTTEYRDEVLAAIRRFARSGVLGMGFPTMYGGGGDIGASIAGFETMALGDLSLLVKVGVNFGLFGGAILHLGTRRHHEAYLPDLITGDLLGCFAMTESGHGSNVQALDTAARYDPEADEFVINTPHDHARKDYIGSAARHAELAVVFAQLEVGSGRDVRSEGVHAFVVPLRERSRGGKPGKVLPGVRIEDDGPKMGLNGVDNGRIWFDNIRIPRDNLLDRYATVDEHGDYRSPIEDLNRRFFTVLGTLIQGRVCVGGGAINASKVAMAIAVRYAEMRRQFGDPGSTHEELLLDYGMHQRRLLPLLARTYALHFAQEVLALELHEVFSVDGGDTDAEAGGANSSDPDREAEKRRRSLESRAAATKVLGTWHATRTIQECREACGGAGYLSRNRFDRLKNDTEVFTTFEGDNHVLLQLVAKGLLTDFSSSFEDLDQLGMVRFVAGLAVDTVIERTAVHKITERIRDVLPGGDDGWDQEAGLLDPEYQLAMFRWREEHMLSAVARRLKRGMDSDMDPVQVFSRVQDHVIASAWAHAERLVLEAFVAKCQGLPEGDNKVALSLLCDLFALSTIESDRGWWMEHGRLSSQRSKAISREVGSLCRRIRPLARQYVDAFGIPEEMLRAELLTPLEGQR